jgi:hypothetical protein
LASSLVYNPFERLWDGLGGEVSATVIWNKEGTDIEREEGHCALLRGGLLNFVEKRSFNGRKNNGSLKFIREKVSRPVGKAALSQSRTGKCFKIRQSVRLTSRS